ncbi:opticin [Monodelphis domestica]|uniref:opticin n=1 Tax=Monodelphis domestica TaxID=13616 RepID=UPI0024E21AC5|nr:opticin [Monodelphis domestica]
MRISAIWGLIALVIWKTEAMPPRIEGGRKQEQPRDEGTSYDSLELGSYDPNLDNYDLSNYEERAIKNDYGEPTPKTKVDTLIPSTMSVFTKRVMATMAPRTGTSVTKPSISDLLNLLTAMGVRATGRALKMDLLYPLYFGPLSDLGLPTCLVCVCLGTSVYCDDADLERIPPLPQETTYFYARFNHISRIQSEDFKGLRKLKRIDLTSNSISTIEDDALQLLPALQELIIPENKLIFLPKLPGSVVRLDAQFNNLRGSGILPESFKELKKLEFLYLSDNEMDYIPVPLPSSLRSLHLQNNHIQKIQEGTFCDAEDHKYVRRVLEDIRLDGNPINLSLTPNAYFCLPRLPIGSYI